MWNFIVNKLWNRRSNLSTFSCSASWTKPPTSPTRLRCSGLNCLAASFSGFTPRLYLKRTGIQLCDLYHNLDNKLLACRSDITGYLFIASLSFRCQKKKTLLVCIWIETKIPLFCFCKNTKSIENSYILTNFHCRRNFSISLTFCENGQ